ncbi:MAG: RidA family protein [Ilumatobacteraceae bacterium]|jgi:2-iminobutanoate/2-iminopropanoate deaminase
MAAKKKTVKKSATKKAVSKKSTAKKGTAKKGTAKKAASKAAAPVGPYTPVVRAGDWVIVSGQLGLKDGVMAKGVAAQTAQAVVNLKARLAEAGVTINDVKKTLCFLTDMDTFATFNEAYVAGFGKSRPARSTIGVASLPASGQVEIEAWAYKPLR